MVTLYPNDRNYPSILKASYKKEIYCKGNIQILNNKRISLIFGSTISEKELSAICKILEELKKEDVAVVMCLNNKKQLEIAKILLENNYKLIMIIPYGILQFKYSDNLRKYQDKYTVLSFLSPMQEVRRYEYVNSLKKCLTLADIVLCCCENTEDIEKIVKYLKGYNNLVLH